MCSPICDRVDFRTLSLKTLPLKKSKHHYLMLAHLGNNNWSHSSRMGLSIAQIFRHSNILCMTWSQRTRPPHLMICIRWSSKVQTRKRIFKTDQKFLRCLVAAYASGRTVSLDNVLNHELLPVPISLTEMNGSLRTGNKVMLCEILTIDIACPATIDLEGQPSCLVIDGQARIMAIGKPASAKTCDDLADVFTVSVLQCGRSYAGMDVVFDRCREESIKARTRTQRTKTSRPIRRIVEGRHVPFPKSSANFIALPENKADLLRFLSEELLAAAPNDKVIVVAGSFEDECEVRSSQDCVDLHELLTRRRTHTLFCIYCIVLMNILLYVLETLM